MLIPSIDLRGGQAVQLVGGATPAIDAGDPMPIADDFARVGELAVIDLDAALGTGDNRRLVEGLVRRAACRVGGGIRDVETALGWLDAGAASVILGTAARPEVLSPIPRDRCFAALDARDGIVMDEGWQRSTGVPIFERLRELAPYVRGFLVTVIEREGRMSGVDLELARALREAAGDREVVFAGGVRDASEVAALDRLGIDAQVGMALYTGAMTVADTVVATLEDRAGAGPWPTVITDERGIALGLAWSTADSIRRAFDVGRGVYWSRSRASLWEKGATSGATQELVAVDLDCDRDALRFTVRQAGAGFCHRDTRTCWGPARGLDRTARLAVDRRATAPAGSWTRRLLDEPALLGGKLREEADELAVALASESEQRVAEEAADVAYAVSVGLASRNVTWEAVDRVLDLRGRRVRRRSELEAPVGVGPNAPWDDAPNDAANTPPNDPANDEGPRP